VSDAAPGHTPRAGRVGLIAVVLLASLCIGFFADRMVRPAPGGLRPLSEPLPKPPPEAADTRANHPIPEKLPELELPGLDGSLQHLSKWSGKPLVVNFWATWCEPCRREIPLLKKLRRERAGDGLEIVGIAVDLRPDVQKYVASEKIDYPVLVGEDGGLAAAQAFGMDTVLPFSVFADREGRIVALKVGELHPDEAGLILDRVRAVDRGALAIADARQQIRDGLERAQATRALSGS
jgi:thiol-disulfide isomerase/thioredoxin